jgi:hypothetical protein
MSKSNHGANILGYIFGALFVFALFAAVIAVRVGAWVLIAWFIGWLAPQTTGDILAAIGPTWTMTHVGVCAGVLSLLFARTPAKSG